MEQSEKVDRGIRGCQKGTGRGTEGAPKEGRFESGGAAAVWNNATSGFTPCQSDLVLVVPAQQRTSKQAEGATDNVLLQQT